MSTAYLKGGKIVCGTRMFDVASVVGIVSTDAGTSITLRSGESALVGDCPEFYYSLRDACPWAIAVQ